MYLCTIFYSISSNIDEVLSNNPSANVFFLRDFNVHHKDWLTFSDRMILLRWLTFLLRSLTLDLFLCSDASICSTKAFLPLRNSDHAVVAVSIDFSSNSKRDALFHRIAYNYSCADWGGLCDNFRDVPWEGIFKLRASAAVSEFCEWVQFGSLFHL